MSQPIAIQTKNGLTAPASSDWVLAKVKQTNETNAGRPYYFKYNDKGDQVFMAWADPSSLHPATLAKLNDNK